MRLRYLAIAMAAVALAAAQRVVKREPDVPYVPTTNPVVEGMLKLAGVKSSDTVYDLGCGDGRIVIAAARIYGAHGVGVDINPQRIAESRENARKAGVEGLVRFEEKDLFEADIHDATVVALFLSPDTNLKLRPKLLQELKPGARIVSHSFDMASWKADREEVIEGRHIFLWTIAAKR
ncbi:MAG TPA: class I SAM-dependent methyltransferase [Bryobacteraceae bacterium]|nr:class I SAM-dependent methyltransferase [Bryobacteraceae bacterium]